MPQVPSYLNGGAGGDLLHKFSVTGTLKWQVHSAFLSARAGQKDAGLTPSPPPLSSVNLSKLLITSEASASPSVKRLI